MQDGQSIGNPSFQAEPRRKDRALADTEAASLAIGAHSWLHPAASLIGGLPSVATWISWSGVGAKAYLGQHTDKSNLDASPVVISTGQSPGGKSPSVVSWRRRNRRRLRLRYWWTAKHQH